MLMWYLFEAKDGWCVVNQNNVLKTGTVEIDEKCKFFYKGKEYEGRVLRKDGKLNVFYA